MDWSFITLLKEKKTEDFLVVEYKVKKGDNLSRIASKYRVKIQDITSMNKISDKKYLQPGQILQIPMQGYDEYMQTVLSSNKTKKILYEVKPGDTLTYETSIHSVVNSTTARLNDEYEFFTEHIPFEI